MRSRFGRVSSASTTRARGSAGSARSAFSLVELVVVLAIMTVAMAMFAQTIASSARLDPVAVESATAAEAARSTLEKMRNHPFAERFALYNDDPDDDPGGPGSAPGSRFNVPGLMPLAVDGFVGQIIFPTFKNQLREDVDDDNLGMPRDLSGDGVIDAADHAQDCLILPVKIRLDWTSKTGSGGKRTFSMFTMFPKQ